MPPDRDSVLHLSKRKRDAMARGGQPWSPATRHRARLLREQGKSIDAIGAELGASRSTVWEWVKGVPMVRECRLCGNVFETLGDCREFCTDQHAHKWYRIYGTRAA